MLALQCLVEEDNDKRTIISLREIGDGKLMSKKSKQVQLKDFEKNQMKSNNKKTRKKKLTMILKIYTKVKFQKVV